MHSPYVCIGQVQYNSNIIFKLIERPNHNLSYSIGIGFCLEDIDSVRPYVTIECYVGPMLDSFALSYTIERILLNGSQEVLQKQRDAYGILQLNKSILLPLFSVDTEAIAVSCTLTTNAGVGVIGSTITVCGMHTLM